MGLDQTPRTPTPAPPRAPGGGPDLAWIQDAVRARLLTTEALKVWLQLRAEGGFAPDDLYGLEVLITRGLVAPEMRDRLEAMARRLDARRAESTIELEPRGSPSPQSTVRVAAVAPAAGSLPLFGPYEILREIARGGMGVVYQVRNLNLGRIEALKVLQSEEQLAPTALKRFMQEASIVARVRHEHIVEVYDVGELDGRHYFTMEYVEGPTLKDVYADGRPAQEQTLRWLRDVALGLHAAHEADIIHRDIKPSNIIITPDGRPKLMDFGLAKVESPIADLKTRTGAIVGTAQYMAPEQAQGLNERVDRTTDVFGLGIVMYEGLTGQRPYEGETLVEVIRQTTAGQVVPPRRINHLIGRDAETICLKAMAFEQARRYPTAQALAEDIDRLLADRPILGRPASPVYRIRRWLRNNTAVTALGLLVILTPLVVWLWRDHARRGRLQELSVAFQGHLEEESYDAARDALAAAREIAAGDPRIAGLHRRLEEAIAERRTRTIENLLEQARRLAARAQLGSSDEKVSALQKAIRAYETVLAESPQEQSAQRGRFDCQMAIGRIELARERPQLAKRSFQDAAEQFDEPAAQAEAAEAIVEATQREQHEATEHRRRVAEAVRETRRRLEAPGAGEEAKTACMMALLPLKSIEMRQELLTLTKDAQAQAVREVAVRTLGWMQEAGATAALRALLEDPQQEVGLRYFAAEALHRIDSDEAREILRAARRVERTDLLWRIQPFISRVAENAKLRDYLPIMRGQSWTQPAADLDPQEQGRWDAAEADLERGRYAQAAEALEAHLARHPQDAAAHLRLALARIGLDRPEEAVSAFGEALRGLPGQSDLLYARGLTLLRLAVFEAAEADLQAVLQADPAHALAWDALAQLYRRQSRLREALQHADQAIAHSPISPQAFFTRAEIHRQEGRGAEALADYDASIRLGLADPAVLERRASLCMELERYAEADRDLEQLLETEPDRISALRLDAQCKIALSRGRDALTLLDRAIAAAPDGPENGESYFLRAQVLDLLGYRQRAAQNFERAAALGFEPLRSRLLLAQVLLTQAGYMDSDARQAEVLRQALTQFELVIAERPDHIAAREGRMEVRIKLGDFAGAEAEIDYFLGQVGDTVDLRHWRGFFRLQQRKLAGAREDLRRALDERPKDASALYLLACVEVLDDQPAEGLDLLEQAVEAGYANLTQLAGDPLLAKVRGEERYRALLKRLRERQGPP